MVERNLLYNNEPTATFNDRFGLPVEPLVMEQPTMPVGAAVQPVINSGLTLTPVDFNPFTSDLSSTGTGLKPVDKLLGLGGQERLQLWPEKVVRSAATLASDVITGKETYIPGLRREDITDKPIPGGILGPIAAQPNDSVMERAQDMANVAVGGGMPMAAKNVLGMSGGRMVQPSEIAKPFYSAVEHTLNNVQQAKMTGDQWLGTIANKPGVKPEELKWIGLEDFLNERKGQPVTKQEVQDFVNSNKVELKEVNKGDHKFDDPGMAYLMDFDTTIANIKNVEDVGLARRFNVNFRETFKEKSDEQLFKDIETYKALPKFDGSTKFNKPNLVLPGGENYREMLLTLPVKENPERSALIREGFTKEQVNNMMMFRENTGYKSSHWDEPNVLAHIRTNDRVIDGKKSLHIEEIQSDWHQAGKKQGYKDQNQKMSEKELDEFDGLMNKNELNQQEQIRLLQLKQKADAVEKNNQGVPDAPFKKTWHELALKRMIREAAEKGYDRLSWTPGEAQAARYDLSKQVADLTYLRNEDGSYRVIGTTHSNEMVPVGENIPKEKLFDYIGKELASKIHENKAKNYTYRDAELKVGGEGMKGFYDQIIPKALEKLGKEHGVKVKEANVIVRKAKPDYLDEKGKVLAKGVNEIKEPVYYIDIPQSLKNTATSKGFPLFSSGVMLSPIEGNPFEQNND